MHIKFAVAREFFCRIFVTTDNEHKRNDTKERKNNIRMKCCIKQHRFDSFYCFSIYFWLFDFFKVYLMMIIAAWWLQYKLFIFILFLIKALKSFYGKSTQKNIKNVLIFVFFRLLQKSADSETSHNSKKIEKNGKNWMHIEKLRLDASMSTNATHFFPVVVPNAFHYCFFPSFFLLYLSHLVFVCILYSLCGWWLCVCSMFVLFRCRCLLLVSRIAFNWKTIQCECSLFPASGQLFTFHIFLYIWPLVIVTFALVLW